MCYMPKFEDLRRFVMVEAMQKYGYMPNLALTWVYKSLFDLPPSLLCHMQGFVVCEAQNLISGLIVIHGASLAVKGGPQAVRSTLDSKLAHDSVVIKQKWNSVGEWICVGDDFGIMGTSMNEPQSVRKRCALYEICIKGLRATCF